MVAIPEGDDQLKRWLEEAKVTVFEGPEEDVLTRYVTCAYEWNLDYVVRVTADCPLIDPIIVGTVINMGFFGKFDYLSNTVIRTFPDGYDVEWISKRALNYLDQNAKGTAREHVTSWLLDTANVTEFQKEYRAGQLTGNIDFSCIKLSLDTPEDYETIKSEFKKIKGIREESNRLYQSNRLDKLKTSESLH
jgi:spore coat polysaccharide biosynthesis protein SpsF (cytidylyltransferase family)